MTTTPQAGTGAGRTPGVALQLSEMVLKSAHYDDGRGLFLRSDTEVRIEIEGISTLVNTRA
ncbi:hypothetical protein [Streptomyces sp. NPDC020298]|uniref:hypothetical protein n=1 Tax=unclassified Streptomyces TaxID=2593676 RepID=UPI0033D559C7